MPVVFYMTNKIWNTFFHRGPKLFKEKGGNYIEEYVIDKIYLEKCFLLLISISNTYNVWLY